MGRYRIIYTKQSYKDLRRVLDDLKELTLSPATAKRIIQMIKNKINKLSDFPGMCPLYEQSPFSGKGIRFLSAENYSVLYTTDDKRCIVYILRIYNARRDPKKINIQ